MRKQVIVDLPDIVIMSDEDDMNQYITSQATKGKLIISQLVAEKFKMTERNAMDILIKLENQGILKSSYKRIVNKSGRPVRMRVFQKA